MSDQAPRRARFEWEFYAIGAVTTALTCAVISTTRVSDYARTGRVISYGESLFWDETSGLALLVLLPAIVAFARRFDVTRPPHWRAALAHLAASVPFSLVHVTLMSLFRSAGYAVFGGRYPLFGPLRDWPYEYSKDVITYLAIIGIYWGWRAIRRPAPASPAGQSPAPAPDGRAEAPIEVRDGPRRLYVRPDEIAFIEAAGNYAELHLAARSLLHRASLASLEQRLGACGFARIHRARLVNRAAVAAIESNAAGDFTVTLRDGRTVAGSRRYRAALSPLETPRIAD